MPLLMNRPATAPEYRIGKELDKMGIFYEFQSQFLGGREKAGGVIADFYLVGYSLIISILGAYWHYGNPARLAQDLIQRQAVLSQGVNTIYIDEDNALRNPRYYIEQALMGIDHSRLSRL